MSLSKTAYCPNCGQDVFCDVTGAQCISVKWPDGKPEIGIPKPRPCGWTGSIRETLDSPTERYGSHYGR